MDVKRFLPLGGVAAVAVVMLAVAVLGGNTPGNDASGAEVASYYDAHGAREIAAAFLLAASAPLLVIFGASLAAALWPSEVEAARRPVWELMMLGAGGSLLARTRLYRWLGWAALALGIALFIPFVDFVALLLSGVWILVTSVTLFSERAEAQYAAAPRMAS